MTDPQTEIDAQQRTVAMAFARDAAARGDLDLAPEDLLPRWTDRPAPRRSRVVPPEALEGGWCVTLLPAAFWSDLRAVYRGRPLVARIWKDEVNADVTRVVQAAFNRGLVVMMAIGAVGGAIGAALRYWVG